LTGEEQAAIDAHGLYNLSDFLPKRPSEVELKVIKEMFEASVDGQPYDPDRWSQYFKPAGFGGNDRGESAPAVPAPAATAPAPKLTVVDSTPPFDVDDEPAEADAPVVTAAKPTSDKAADILAMIRNRNKQ
jgi:hypothetical protein